MSIDPRVSSFLLHPVNRRFPLLALAPLVVLPSCSAFKLSENGSTSPRTFGRFSVAEGRGLTVSPTVTLKPVPAPAAAATTPAPVVTQPAPVVATVTEKAQAAPTPEPVKPADRPATKRHSEQDADALRLPGDLLNQLPGEKDYKPSNSGANGDAPVIAKPPGAR